MVNIIITIMIITVTLILPVCSRLLRPSGAPSISHVDLDKLLNIK